MKLTLIYMIPYLPDAKSGMLIIKVAPLPEDILTLGIDGVNQIWRDAKLRAVGKARAKTLIEAAEHSIGNKEGAVSAGLALVENSSGKHKGETTISRRGRKRLRYLLFEVAMSLVSKNQEFRELHNYYTTRRLNPLKKMQSLMAIAAKLIRVFYAMLTKGVDYDPKKKSVTSRDRQFIYRLRKKEK